MIQTIKKYGEGTPKEILKAQIRKHIRAGVVFAEAHGNWLTFSADWYAYRDHCKREGIDANTGEK